MRRTSRTRYTILGFLTWRSMSGYDIKKAVEQSTSNFWSESYGQIYPVLQRLADEGLARRVGVEAVGPRERQVYAITARGRRELRRWLAEPTDAGTVRNELLLKLFFGREAEPGVHRAQIEVQRRRMVEQLAHLDSIRALLGDHRSAPDAPYWMMTLRMGELQYRAQLAWCEESLATLERLERQLPVGPKRRKTP